MKLLIHSDLHNDIEPYVFPEDLKVDVLALLGDIDNGEAGLLYAADCKEFAKEVIYLTGNHDYYGDDIVSLDEELRTLAEEVGVHFLQNDSLVLGNVRFLGGTMWTDFELDSPQMPPDQAMIGAKFAMNDYRFISNGAKGLKPSDTLELHVQFRAWLEKQLKKRHKGPTVVLTHHAPSEESLGQYKRWSSVNFCYASNMEDLMDKYKPDIWAHGHCHEFMDYTVGKTRVISNPRGYQGYHRQHTGFDPRMIVEVGSPLEQSKELPQARAS